MFAHNMTVQLHHTDAYSIMFFANQFVFCHDAFQAYLTSLGYPLAHDRTQAEFVAVVVHAESDYKAPIRVGDQLRIEYRVAEIGSTSFTNSYTFKNQDGVTVGTAKIVQVTLDPKTGKKIAVPPKVKALLVRNT
jgi:YbgC/YbaW family acyl-CoA thioester hydrolase